MKAIILCLEYPNCTKSQQSRLSKEIYGFTDNSNNGRYSYEREGILTKIPKLVLAKAAVIIYEHDREVIQKIRKLGVLVTEYPISIKKWN